MAAKARILVGTVGLGVMTSPNDGKRQGHCFRNKLTRPWDAEESHRCAVRCEAQQRNAIAGRGLYLLKGWICFDTCRSHISGV
jgi:hypothetical protein